MAFASINGVKMYYEVHGEGYPLLLVPGYTCDSSYFLPVLDPLSKYFQVVVMDNRGVGQTQDDGAELSVEIFADDIMALADHLGLVKPHVIGQSMGGTIAQSVGIRYGERIGKLGVFVSSAKWRLAMLWGLKSHWEMRQQGMDLMTIIDAMLPWVYGEAFLADEEKVAWLRQAIVDIPHPQSLEDQIRQYQALVTFDARDEVSNIAVPTLIVNGREDLIAMPDESAFLHQQIKDSKWVELPCGHAIHIEQTKAWCDLVHDFFTD